MSNEPKDVTLPDSGATVRVKFIGPMLINDMRKGIHKTMLREGWEKPLPPKLKIEYGKETRWEPVDDDPKYLARLVAYDNEFGARFLDLMLRYGVEYTLTVADQERVAQYRADSDLDLPENDMHLFVTRLLAVTAADLGAIQTAIMETIQPTEAQVAASTESFRPNLPG